MASISPKNKSISRTAVFDDGNYTTHNLNGARSDKQTQMLQMAFDKAVRGGLHYASLGMGLLYLLLAVSHPFLFPNTIAPFLSAVALGTAVILLGIHLVIRRRLLRTSLANPIAAFVIGLAQMNTLLQIYLTREPHQSTYVLFVILGVSLLFLSWRWFIFTLLGALATWAMVAALLPSSLDRLHFGFILFLGTLLSVAIFIVRSRTLHRYEILRLQDKQQKRKLRNQARQLETSIAIGQRITSILDLDTLLKQVTQLIKENYAYHYVGVFLLEENGEYVQWRAGSSDTSHSSNSRLKVGEEGIIGWVAANGRPARVDNVSKDSRYVRLEATSRTRSELDLPLSMGETMLGVLSLQSEHIGTFKEDDVPFLQMLADQVAIAIYNASLYKGEQAARYLAEMMHQTGRTLTDTLEWPEVLERILQQLADIVSYDRGSVLVRQDDELLFMASRGFPPESHPNNIRISLNREDETIFREIYRTKRPLCIPDVAERPDWQRVDSLPLARSWLGVPLIRGDEVIGMLSLTRERPAPYTEEEIKLATAFAGQAAIAFGNAQLYDQVSRFSQQLEYEVHHRTIAVREAYERLERLDRTKSDFITISSHELRTPLTLLRGYSQMLLKDKSILENEYHHRLVSGIFSGTQRLAEIVTSMADMARIDNRELELYPEPVSIAALIQPLTDEFEKSLTERNLTLIIEDMSHLPDIEADPEALRKVFYHLIVNAIKYTPDGGSITVSGGPLISRGLDLPAEGVEVIVSDTGIGIDPEAQELVFTKFFQTGEVALHSTGKTKFKGGGPGLGLTIARGIVEAHRGKLWVESAGYDEKTLPGSHFHVALPLTQDRGIFD